MPRHKACKAWTTWNASQFFRRWPNVTAIRRKLPNYLVFNGRRFTTNSNATPFSCNRGWIFGFRFEIEQRQDRGPRRTAVRSTMATSRHLEKVLAHAED